MAVAAPAGKLDCAKVLPAAIREQHFKDLKVVDDTTAPFEHVYCRFETAGGDLVGTLGVGGCFVAKASSKEEEAELRKGGKDMPGVGKFGLLKEEGPYIVAHAQDDNSSCFVGVTGATEDEAKARAKALIDLLPIK